jgi:hypothetical protein
VVHGVGMCGGAGEERAEVDGEKEVGRRRKGRKERNTRQSGLMFVPLFGSCICKNSLTQYEHLVVYLS